jgi:glycosyltransferase involved in cell wall biosynthesis
MKILLYTPTVNRGGVHRVVETLFPALVSTFPDVEFAVLGQEFDEIGLKIAYPCDFKPMPPFDKLPAHPHQFPYLYANHGRFYSYLERKSHEYDLIYCPVPWWTMGFTRWTLKVPFVTTISDFAFDVIDMGTLADHFRSTVEKMRRHVKAFVVHSDYWKQHAEERYHLQNVHVIGHTPDFVVPNFNASRSEGLRVSEKHNLPREYILAFHCYGHKDPVTIIRGYQWAKHENPNLPPLVIAGIGTDSYREGAAIQPGAEGHVHEVRIALRSLPPGSFHILGAIDEEDVAGLYACARVAISATLSEGDLPGTAFEAIQSRVPFVCSDFPVFTEKLGESCAWIFERGNPALLAVRLHEAYFSDGQKEQRAVEKLANRTAVNVAQDYMNIFRSVLNV